MGKAEYIQVYSCHVLKSWTTSNVLKHLCV